MLLLATNLEKEIREHGAKDYPHECCGAMLGTDGEAGREVRSLFPLINRRDDSPRNRFSITPEDFLAAERAATERGLDLLGCPITRRGRANSTGSMPGRGTAT